MINLQQIENMLKAQGLTGDEFKREFEQQCLLFGRRMIDEILSGVDNEDFTYKDAAFYLAQISEIFITAARYKFPHDFAEHFQIEVFNRSPQHTSNFCDWRDKTFDAPENESKLVETSAADSPIKSEFENEVANIALLLSGLLNNPNVPETIRGGVAQGIEDLFNSEIDQSEILDFHRSPEYIAMVLRGTVES